MATKIKQIRESLIHIGKKAHEKYVESEDLKAGLLAVKAMAEATRTSVAQIHYKRLTGTPTKIDFLEE